MGFFRSSTALFDIAAHTGSSEIFPAIDTTARSRHDMIDRQIAACVSTVLTFMIVTVENIPPSQGDFTIGHRHVVPQADDSR